MLDSLCMVRGRWLVTFQFHFLDLVAGHFRECGLIDKKGCGAAELV